MENILNEVLDMFWWFLLGSIFMIYIMLVKLSITIEYLKNDGGQVVRLKVYNEIFKLRIPFIMFDSSKLKTKVMNKERNKKQAENKKYKQTKDMDKLFTFIKKLYNFSKQNKRLFLKALKNFKNKIVFDDILIKINFGLEDAALTGITTGALWAMIYNTLSLLNRYFLMKNTEINIEPDFNGIKLNVSFCSIFKVRIVNIINMALYAMLILVKFTLYESCKRQKNIKGGALYV